MLKKDKRQVKSLRESLPHGSCSKIKERLATKGSPFSVQYISRCLNPKRGDFNKTILEEAILLSCELRVQQRAMNRRLLQFKTEVL